MKSFSNKYIFFYITVLVVVVVALLTVVTLGLKPRQTANRTADKAMQILHASGYQDVTSDKAVALFSRVAEKKTGEREVYGIRCADGSPGVVMRVDGKGLWGAIWGYVVLDEERTTVKGVVFSHKSETPGLGANIAEENFTSRFVGKKLYDANGNFTSVRVLQKGKSPDVALDNRVDAISGATLTSKGVDKMLQQLNNEGK